MIPSYDTFDDLWLNTAVELLDKGHKINSRAGSTIELMGFVARLEDPTACFMYNPRRRLSAAYAAAETLWYLSGTDKIEMMLDYAPQYKRFANERPVIKIGKQPLSEVTTKGSELYAHGAYGKRWADNRQLDVLVSLLSEKQETRQAVLSMWRDSDLTWAYRGKMNDIPCTLSMHFLVRNGKLNLTTTMRSNDFWLGTPYDFFAFCHVQIILAAFLQLDVGFYQHQANSLHIYEKNMKAFEEATQVSKFTTENFEYVCRSRELHDEIQHALRLERHNVKHHTMCYDCSPLQIASPLGQLVAYAATRHDSGSKCPRPDYSRMRLGVECSTLHKHIQKFEYDRRKR